MNEEKQKPEDNNQNDLPHVERILVENAQGDIVIFELHMDFDAGGCTIKVNGGAKFAFRLSDRRHVWGEGDNVEAKFFVEDVDLHDLLSSKRKGEGRGWKIDEVSELKERVGELEAQCKDLQEDLRRQIFLNNVAEASIAALKRDLAEEGGRMEEDYGDDR